MPGPLPANSFLVADTTNTINLLRHGANTTTVDTPVATDIIATLSAATLFTDSDGSILTFYSAAGVTVGSVSTIVVGATLAAALAGLYPSVATPAAGVTAMYLDFDSDGFILWSDGATTHMLSAANGTANLRINGFQFNAP